MATQRAVVPVKRLFNGFKTYQESVRTVTRSMATEAPLPQATLSQSYLDAHLNSAPTRPIIEDESSIPSTSLTPSTLTATTRFQAQRNPFLATTQCTLYDFPSMEPVCFVTYPSTHLLLPLRRDLLHRAVVYEADGARQGTASTKWRSEVHGSGRKIRPQKGTGKARLGDKKSPMLRGGGVAFGPKPRDFSTELPKKVYDLALRTALSYRYRRGELIITNGRIDIKGPNSETRERLTRDVLHWNGLGQASGKTLFITDDRREGLFEALEGTNMDREATALSTEIVEIRDLLKSAKLVIERLSLDHLLNQHEADLGPTQRLSAFRKS